MQYFLDHIASVLVVSVVLLIMVLVQIRGSQTAAETTINNIVYDDVINVHKYLQRDLENMLTEDQATDAQNDGSYNASGVLICTGRDTITSGVHSTRHTVSFTFPTVDPLDGDLKEIEYYLVDTGNTITLPTQDSTQTIPLFRLNRIVDGFNSGGSSDNVISFRIETLNQADAYDSFSIIDGNCATTLRKVRFEFKMAQTGVDLEAGDKVSTSQTNISRLGTTVHLHNWSI